MEPSLAAKRMGGFNSALTAVEKKKKKKIMSGPTRQDCAGCVNLKTGWTEKFIFGFLSCISSVYLSVCLEFSFKYQILTKAWHYIKKTKNKCAAQTISTTGLIKITAFLLKMVICTYHNSISEMSKYEFNGRESPSKNTVFSLQAPNSPKCALKNLLS